MSAKKTARLRRAKRGRAKINELRMNRLCVFRSPKHIYAQIISATGNEILVSASTLEKSNKSGATGNIDAAGKIGKLIAERAKKAGIEKVHLIVQVMRIMDVSRHWQRLHERVDWNFKG